MPSGAPIDAAAPDARESSFRPEIQALRAAAVLLVVVYHFWPSVLPGGYVGVDVFFVISGFLITGHLLREVERSGTVSLGAFWARRARRLLPASLLVIVVSAITTLLVVPITFWQDWFRQMAASVFYVVNWLLAVDSVDYLAAENNASPVQHYWSLSLEEQYYLVWPLLIILAAVVARRMLTRRTVIVIMLVAVTAVSFALSVFLTIREPAMAYFITPTRVWEFGVGALIGFLPALTVGAWRVAIAWAGIVGVVATGVLFTASTPFPGYTALLPVLSTAAVIWAGTTTQRWSLAHLSRFRPVQYVGDVSYSFYLWHWPLIVFAPFVLGRPMNLLDAFVLFAASFVLAALTKRFVEDPVRTAPRLTAARPRLTFAAVGAAMVIALVAPGAGYVTAGAEERAGMARVQALLDQDADCLGADAMADPGCENPDIDDELLPSLAAFKSDNSTAYDCYGTSTGSGEVESCTYESDAADPLRVAVTGDSHGAMLSTALIPRLDELDWTLDTYVARGCSWAEPDFEASCSAYRQALEDRFLQGDYDLIIVAAFRGRDETGTKAAPLAAARAEAWGTVIDAGIPVVVVADNPLVPDDMVDCIVMNPVEAAERDACVLPRDRLDWPIDSLPLAAEQEPRAHLIELDDLYCDDEGCPMVIGNTIVYRDAHHMSATFLRTLSPHLIDRIEDALPHLGDDRAADAASAGGP